MNVLNEGYTYETNGDVDVATPSFLSPTKKQVKSVRKDGVLVSESYTVYGFLDKLLWGRLSVEECKYAIDENGNNNLVSRTTVLKPDIPQIWQVLKPSDEPTLP